MFIVGGPPRGTVGVFRMYSNCFSHYYVGYNRQCCLSVLFLKVLLSEENGSRFTTIAERSRFFLFYIHCIDCLLVLLDKSTTPPLP
eukprot:gene5948-4257_t